MYLVDSNVFIRFLTGDHQEQSSVCEQFLRRVENGFSVKIPQIVMAEIEWVLSGTYDLPKEEVVQSLHAIRSLSNTAFVDDANITEALRIYKENNVKFVDAYISSIPGVLSGRFTIVSYDRDFDKIKGVKRVEPSNLLK